MYNREYDYHRLIICTTLTTLTTQSPLHIGTGDAEDPTVSAGNDQGSLNTVLTDRSKQNKQPYLPASTLRGYLRGVVLSAEQDGLAQHGVSERLFGCARQSEAAATDTTGDAAGNATGAGTNPGNMGALRVYDACLADPKSEWEGVISRTAIDPVTLTAKQHSLNVHQVVNSGVVFTWRLELDRVTTEDAQLLMGALDTLNHQDGLVGKGKSTGQGKLSHGQLTLKGQSREAFAAWVLSDQTAIDYPPVVLTATPIRLNVWHAETIRLTALSPVLVNDPVAAEKEKEKEKEKAEHEHAPGFVFMQRGGEAIIPGSTLKGWFRSRCRKILLTLNQGQRETTVDYMLGQLFGSTEQASHIRFHDACVDFTSADEHTQTFNAVDRFTGGVKDGALYTVKALWLGEDKFFESTVSYRKDKITGWMQLLLLFAWRDAEDGDLVLGWGKAKGYGRLKLHTEGGGTQHWIEKCQEQLAQWEVELDQELKKELDHGGA